MYFILFFFIPCPPLSQCLLEVSYNICLLFIIIDFFVYMFLSRCSFGIAPSKNIIYFLIKLQSVSLCPSVPPSLPLFLLLPSPLPPSLSLSPSLPTSILSLSLLAIIPVNEGDSRTVAIVVPIAVVAVILVITLIVIVLFNWKHLQDLKK